jgi:hypothetical protein
MSADTTQAQSGSKYDRLIAAARAAPPTPTAVAHPCDETSLRGAVDSASAGISGRSWSVGPHPDYADRYHYYRGRGHAYSAAAGALAAGAYYASGRYNQGSYYDTYGNYICPQNHPNYRY